jgi:predicted glycosyltransferase involved in capsule biosynthesis
MNIGFYCNDFEFVDRLLKEIQPLPAVPQDQEKGEK